VKGLVLLDAATPLQGEHGSARLQARERIVPLGEMVWARLEDLSGWTRLSGGCRADQKGFDPKTAQMLAEDECHLPFESIVQELDSVHQSGEETMQRTSFGNLPVLIFSRDTDESAQPGMDAGVAVEYRAWWNGMQANLLNLSTDSRRVVVKGSGHYVFLKRPGLVVREVQEFVEHVRDRAIPGNDATQPGPLSRTE
jgi:pimeloyl-ACP methyl ester carboxylesterase